MALSVGTRLGPYEILGALGAGGMGEVYRTLDTRLHRVVAVKVLPAHASDDTHARARFEREARAIASLSHPNICAVFDVGHEAGHDYLVMELLEGETLDQRLTRGAFDLAALVDTAVALADALDSAHAHGLIHRDLKPANIFLTMRGQPKILDFGLAKVVAGSDRTTEQDDGLTGPAAVVGTIAYMSPEQLRGEPLDTRTDLFSLGLVLYEMVTGRRAFAGSTGAVVSAAILGQEAAAPRTLRGELPVRLEEAIVKLLEKDRAIRCQSAAELRADLTRVKRQMQAEAARTPPPVVSDGVSVGAPASPAHAPGLVPSSDTQVISDLIGRHRQGLSLGVLALIGVLSAVGYVMWRRTVRAPAARPAMPSPNIVMQPLTFSGNATLGVISPDAKFVAYVRSDDHSLWVRQTSVQGDARIVPAEPGTEFKGLAVTPDSSYVDFVVMKATWESMPDLWRVPFLGGTPRKTVTNIASAPGWSPDGRHMAFVRTVKTSNDFESWVVIADADGSNERSLARRSGLKAFNNLVNLIDNRPSWSPDSSLIAATGWSRDGGEIVGLDAVTGVERWSVAEKDVAIFEVAWLDGTTLLVAKDTPTTSNTQLWSVDVTTQASAPVTRDLAAYRGVSLTADRLAAVATRTDTRGGLWLGGAAAEQMTPVVPESTAAPTDASVSNAGALAYLAPTPEVAAAIWTVRSTESPPQLVIGRGSPFQPVIAPDGSFIVFAEGSGGLYRASLSRTQLTKLSDVGAFWPTLTPDGATALFVAKQSSLQTLWSAPVAGGTAREIFSNPGVYSPPSVSPDGRRVVFATIVNDRHFLIVCDLPDCTNVREHSLSLMVPVWTPDGRGFAHLNPNDPANIWVQPIDGGTARPLTHFTDHRITSFAWSPDGRRLAVTRATVLSDLVLIRGFR